MICSAGRFSVVAQALPFQCAMRPEPRVSSMNPAQTSLQAEPQTVRNPPAVAGMSTKLNLSPSQRVATTPMAQTSFGPQPQIAFTARALGEVGGGTSIQDRPSQWNGPAAPPTHTSLLALAQMVESASVGDGIVDQTPPAKRTMAPLAPMNHRSSGPTANAFTKRSLVGSGWVQHQPSAVQACGASGLTVGASPGAETSIARSAPPSGTSTGKRYYAHPSTNPDPGTTEPPVISWFELQRGAGGATFTQRQIHDASGAGCNFAVRDLDGNGRPDVFATNKHGTFLHLQR